MAHSLTFREGLVVDRQLIYDFIIPNHLEASARNPEELKAQTDDLPTDFPDLYDDQIFKKGKYWLIFDVEKLVGALGCTPDPEITSTIWISFVGVSPAKRGLGLGNRLLNDAFDWLTTTHYSSCRLITLPGVFDAAVHLYTKYGFLEIEERITPHYRVTTMEKKLKQVKDL